jgi:tRNA(Ile)-lysidine synthase
LLLACAQKWPNQVAAVHINHGLQAAANDFEVHCQQFCSALGVPLTVMRVQARHQAGQSPEDAARRARYKAFEALAHTGQAQTAIKTIAIAQHADDQTETLLLALGRGSGLPGLSAMPAQWLRCGVHYQRPLLQVRGADVRAWLAAQGVGFVDDPSNADVRFTRNRLRAHLLPVLAQCFPHFHDTFARSAAHAAQAQALLHEVAEQDLLLTGVPPKIKALQGLSTQRQANVLRHWLRHAHATVPSSAQMHELQRQVAACSTRGHQIHLKIGAGMLQRNETVLHWYNPAVLT